jgi:prepilin-type N-terminal cleavage/methylation domain-containing protein
MQKSVVAEFVRIRPLDIRILTNSGTNASAKRAGFTLVEMLVVMVIILALATLTLALSPRLASSQKSATGASMVQGQLLIAKQRARKDGLPTGLRLIRASTNPADPQFNQVREMHFIQKPDDFNGGQIYVTIVPGNLASAQTVYTVPSNAADFFGGYGPNGDRRLWPVQPGDFLELKGGGLVHRIIDVKMIKDLNGQVGPALILETPVSFDIKSTVDYRILRTPRVLIAETPQELPKDIIIDLRYSVNLNTRVVQERGDNVQTAEILFSPSGALMGAKQQSGDPILWVRDSSFDDFTQGEPTLIAIYQTGLIAAHPISLNGDYYSFTKDGRSSGL